jgi:hypothetical protein
MNKVVCGTSKNFIKYITGILIAVPYDFLLFAIASTIP